MTGLIQIIVTMVHKIVEFLLLMDHVKNIIKYL
jgi:hypothetical protein